MRKKGGTGRSRAGSRHEAKSVGETQRPDGPSILMGTWSGIADDDMFSLKDRSRGPNITLLYIEITEIIHNYLVHSRS